MSDEWVMVPRDLLQRVDAALQRHLDRHAPMRIPVDQTDSDLVQSDVQALIAAPAAPQQVEPVEIVPRVWREALRKLTFMARTSGGTPGPDEGLQTACAEAETLLSKPYNYPPAEPQQAEPVWVRPDQLQKARQGRFLCALGSTQLAADMVPLYLRPDPQVQRLRDALRVILEADWTSDRIRNIARKALEGGA